MKRSQIQWVKVAGEMKRVRLKCQLTLSQVARLAGISRATAQRIESGDASLALSTLLSYASALSLEDALVESMIAGVCGRGSSLVGAESSEARVKRSLVEMMRTK